MDIRKTAIFAESWNVAYRMKPQGSILTDKNTPFYVLPNPFRYWVADPLVFENGGHTYIFAELYDYIRCRGIIGVTEFCNGEFLPWKPIIVEKFHMSYPFVFFQNGEIFMLPETSAANELILYRATEFPYCWERYKTVQRDVRWVDTTIVRSEEGYIGFTEDISEKANFELSFDEELNIKDIEKCANGSYNQYRMGGRLFKDGDSYIRVCQDCSEDYGQALFFRYYDKNFEEQIDSKRISPHQLVFDKNLLLCGMHTYSATKTMEVIDIKTRRFNVLDFCFRILNKARHRLQENLKQQ